MKQKNVGDKGEDSNNSGNKWRLPALAIASSLIILVGLSFASAHQFWGGGLNFQPPAGLGGWTGHPQTGHSNSSNWTTPQGFGWQYRGIPSIRSKFNQSQFLQTALVSDYCKVDYYSAVLADESSAYPNASSSLSSMIGELFSDNQSLQALSVSGNYSNLTSFQRAVLSVDLANASRQDRLALRQIIQADASSNWTLLNLTTFRQQLGSLSAQLASCQASAQGRRFGRGGFGEVSHPFGGFGPQMFYGRRKRLAG